MLRNIIPNDCIPTRNLSTRLNVTLGIGAGRGLALITAIGTDQTCRRLDECPLSGGTADIFWRCRHFRFCLLLP